MASSSTESSKVLCVICNKGKGIFKCEGCSQIFCPKHSIDHRNELGKQLEQIEVTYDLLQQTLIQHMDDPRQHPLLKKIDQWKKKSIEKIRQMAEEARNDLLKDAAGHATQVKQKLRIVSGQLRQGREENDFSEIDLRQWMQKLEELQEELLNPADITVREDSAPLVTKIGIGCQVALDVFERVFGTVQIEENGRLAVKDNQQGHTGIRGKREYNSGRHTVRFLVEQLVQDGWIFFGIISKSEVMQAISFCSPSSYGWSNKNHTYVGGLFTVGQTKDIVQNDNMILMIDCDQRKIELKNERSNLSMNLTIDINQCPFPWQLHINMDARNSRVRIL